MANRKKTGISVGGASILMVFMVLSLATFATLTLTSANADYNLSQRNQQAVLQYYQADGQGEEMLGQIDQLIKQNALLPNSELIALLQTKMPGINVEQTSDGLLSITYTVPVNEQQQLSVALHYTTPATYTIAQWVVESSSEWVPDSENLNLWTGELD